MLSQEIKNFGQQQEFYFDFKGYVDKIINMSQKTKIIKSVLIYGSFLKKKMNLYSDIDLIIISKKKNISKVKIELKNLFNKFEPFIIEYENKIIFYLPSTNRLPSRILKIEISLVNTINIVSKYIIELVSEEGSYKRLMLFNRSKKIEKKLKKLVKIEKEKEFPDLYSNKYHINKILEAYQLSCKSFEKGDDYRFYFYLNICFHHLIVLENSNNGNTNHLYLPEFSLKFVKNKSRKKFFKSKSPSLDMTKANLLRNSYLETFFNILDEMILEKNNIQDINKKEIVKFLTNITDTTYFWNLRDIAYIEQSFIKKSQLFRSSTLSLYNNDPKLLNFIEQFSIKTIIDLRASYEVNEYPYSIGIKNLVELENIPIDPRKNLTEINLKYSQLGTIESFYEIFLTHYQKEIKEILSKISNCSFPVVIHCHAGKDRTGMIIALILLLLQIPEELIIKDYLNSFSDTKFDSMNIFLTIMKEYGGILSYLKIIGYSEKELQLLKYKLGVSE